MVAANIKHKSQSNISWAMNFPKKNIFWLVSFYIVLKKHEKYVCIFYHYLTLQWLVPNVLFPDRLSWHEEIIILTTSVNPLRTMLTHCVLKRPFGILVTIGSWYGLLLSDNKPKPEPMLTYHQLDPPTGTYFSEIVFIIHLTFPFKINLKMLSPKWQPFVLRPVKLTYILTRKYCKSCFINV